MNFSILSEVKRISDRELRRMRDASAIGAAPIAAEWNEPIATIEIKTRVVDLKDDDVPVLLVATLDDPTALAYHSLLRDGRPFAVVLADDAQPIDGVEMSLFHEIAETIPDRTCDLYDDDGSGRRWSREVCDAVEEDKLFIDLGDGELVTCSNWCTRAFFNPTAAPGAKLDALGLCKQPFEIRPGGYAITISSSGNVEQLPMGRRMARRKLHPNTRYSRRLAAAVKHASRTR